MLEIKNISEYRPIQLSAQTSQKVVSDTKAIIDDVINRRDQALLDMTLKFDKVKLERLRVPIESIEASLDKLDSRLMGIYQKAIENITEYHHNTKLESWEKTYEDGSVIGMKVTPIDRAGVYIPGGKAVYPSTVFMNIIPAQIAGVSSIAVVSPPSWNGEPHPLVLASCALLEVDEVYAIGGAQSIAALAYGTDSVEAVDKITGPGNQYVSEAKRQVFGTVGIDSIAGPSEIAILHDDPDTPPEFIAHDMIAQAEHDEEAKCVLITTIPDTAAKVREIILEKLDKIPRSEIVSASLSDHGAIYTCASFEDGAELINQIAPEHLEIFTKNDSKLSLIRNAGAIFIGDWSGVAVGDYYAGPNHTIPTKRAARYASPLTVADFQKKSSLINYSQIRLAAQAESIAVFAESEELHGHAESMRVRLD